MTAAINYILDSLWELWQYLKPKGNVYIAGKFSNDRLFLRRFVPESIELEDGWVQLTQPMPYKEAEKRIENFPLYRVVATKKLPEIGT